MTWVWHKILGMCSIFDVVLKLTLDRSSRQYSNSQSILKKHKTPFFISIESFNNKMKCIQLILWRKLLHRCDLYILWHWWVIKDHLQTLCPLNLFLCSIPRYAVEIQHTLWQMVQAPSELVYLWVICMFPCGELTNICDIPSILVGLK